ncbi:MAG: hypothetical protein KF730_00630 [Sphingomonas sp.]|uniref:hypothetical protein n=1 Tax=Sphingomonas sp. TaxID=28214 RepID=UPI0025D18DA2|nr:hypothetical protein [Sphingomonas sp.]MBX3563057.1 hypothetical protein [Sphingomonas sp.]
MRILLAASALIFAAAPGSASRQDLPPATPSGDPVSCVTLTQIKETRVRDGQTIDFVMRNGKVYRNTLDGGTCPQLGFEKRFAYKVSGNQLCSVDTITVLTEPGLSRGASCGLGQFQPVTLAAAY